MSEEPFMKSAEWISMLKWRLSWGQTGNSDIGTNAFATYATRAAFNKENNSQVMGVYRSRLENPDLKWETTTEWNVGLDMGFMKAQRTPAPQTPMYIKSKQYI